MKVGFFYCRYPLFLSGSYFQEFLNKLAKSVDSISLIASPYPRGSFEKEENIKIFWVPPLNMKHMDQIFFMLTGLLKAVFTKELGEVDVANSVGTGGLLAGLYLKKRFGIPLVCTIEILNEKGTFLNNLYYIIVRFLMTRIPIDKFVCWSDYYWNVHLKKWGIPERKVEVIPGGIDIEKYNPYIDGTKIKSRYAPDIPLIVFAKPLYRENKEMARILVRSIKLLRPRREVKLLIGGGEGKAEVEKLAGELGVGNLVDFMPTTKFTDIPKYIAAGDLIVLPFTYAPTTSRSLLEAMAVGKPIVTIPVGEIANILDNRKSVLFAKLDPEAISQAIDELLSNKELSRQIGRNAAELVKEKFSIQIVVKRTISILRELCST